MKTRSPRLLVLLGDNVDEIFDEIGETLDKFGKELVDDIVVETVKATARNNAVSYDDMDRGISRYNLERDRHEDRVRRRIWEGEDQIRERLWQTQQTSKPSPYDCECGVSYVIWIDYTRESPAGTLDYVGLYQDITIHAETLHCVKCGKLVSVTGKVTKVEINKFNL